MNSFIAPGRTPDRTDGLAGDPVAISSLRGWITVIGIALILSIIAADGYEAWRDHGAAVRDNERAQVMLGRALAEQTARMIQEVDIALSNFAAWRRSAEGMTASESSMRERLRAEIMRMPFVHSAAATGPDGHVLATTGSEPPANLGLEKREAFAVPELARDGALYVGRPFIGSRDQAHTFALSRRIDDQGGAFAGVVVVRLSFDYLARFYSSVDVVAGTSIRLARQDGVTLVQYPSGDSLGADGPHVRPLTAGIPPAGEQVRYVQADGNERVLAQHWVEGYPVVIEVTRSLSDILRPWAEQEAASAARTLTLATLAGLLLLALRAALTRHDRIERERRRLEQALEATRRAEALGLLAASVAHDFNNILTAIVGYGELIRDTAAPGSPETVQIDRLLAAAERARMLVRQVLTFNPRRSLKYQPLAVGPIIAEVLQQLQATLRPSVTLQASGLDGSAPILGDATEVHQVVMNLCANAVHAMPAGGTLEVRLESVEVPEPRDLKLGKLHPGEWIRMSVIDTGIGLAESQLESVFEPFYTTRQPGQGTGIGLTVVRNVIQRMGGALDMESHLGAGTRVSVYWQRVAPPSPVPARPAAEGHGQTVMVVDDEPELVALAEEKLALLGYEPVGFADSRDALEAFRSDPGRFDAVLTDDGMQALRGSDLAASIRAIDPRIPVILMTGHRDTEVDARANAAGVAEILEKPLHAETLRAVLGRRLQVARP